MNTGTRNVKFGAETEYQHIDNLKVRRMATGRHFEVRPPCLEIITIT
jgi:hypothetical protein